jgi:adenine phosphoribosyltransferase
MLSIRDFQNIVRDVPDFPKPGIVFKDITPLLKHPEGILSVTEHFKKQLENKKIDYVCGIESRGFLFGTCLSQALNCGFIPIRKKGKLPAETIKQEYALEYGTDSIEIHKDALKKGDRVIILDDLLATGGTALAGYDLVSKLGAEVEAFAFVIELGFLNGREKLKNIPVVSLLEY